MFINDLKTLKNVITDDMADEHCLPSPSVWLFLPLLIYH